MKTAAVTGASSGIGAAVVRALKADGYRVLAGARRVDRLEALSRETGCDFKHLDVTDARSVAQFFDATETLNVLVNNAGGAKGLDRVADLKEEDWRWMFEANVLGVGLVTKAALSALRASGDALVVAIGSIAGLETYPGGAGYTAAKHAARAVADTLRLEHLGEPIRFTHIAPGLVETEFSVVRFDGDTERARKVYAGLTPLTAEDVAEVVRWTASLPPHVNIDEVVVKPRDQARATLVNRKEGP